MKTKLLIFLTIFFMAGAISFAQDTPEVNKPFPFAQYNEPNLSIISLVANPEGFSRSRSSGLTSYQRWLSNMPTMPPNTPVLNWKGKIISKADTLNRVLDMNIDSKYITDADIPVLLLMHFFRMKGKIEKFNIILTKNLRVNYKEWLHGRYIEEKDKDIYYRSEGLRRVDSDEEFFEYIEFVAKHFNTKSLRLNTEHTDSRAIESSHMYIQYKEDDPDSIGHTAVVLDCALAEYQPRKLIIAYGGNPAQSIVIPNVGRTNESRWTTFDELREQLKEFGAGYMYRWKE